MKILVVDEDQAIREYLEEVLGLMGHAVVSLANGYDAIDYVRDHDVNIAYINFDISDIDGLEILKRIRELDPKVLGVMVCGSAIEGSDAPIEKDICVRLQKPFTIEKLEEINNTYEETMLTAESSSTDISRLDSDEIMGANILVADDEYDIVRIIKAHLKMEGLENVDTAEDGDKAISKFNEVGHDLVIVDIIMPRKGGIEVLRHIKAISPSSQVIIITGNADKDTAITALKLGAYDYIEKPFDLSSLTRIVVRALEKKLLLDKKREMTK